MGSVEELLVQWAMTTGQHPTFGFYNKYNIKPDQAARDICNRGVESIKALVDLASDRRLSVHVRQQFNNAPEYRMRVGDLAKQILHEMAGSNSPVERRLPFCRWTTEDPEVWNEWLAKTDLSDETTFLKVPRLIRKKVEFTWFPCESWIRNIQRTLSSWSARSQQRQPRTLLVII